MTEQKRILNRDIIKYFAVLAMLLNHISFIFLDQESLPGIILTDIGYFTGITMIWFLVEGYAYTRSKKKYAQRLLLFAVISEIPFCLAFTQEGVLQFYGINMIFTLLICFLIVHIMNTWLESPKRNMVVMLLVLATFCSDWGIVGPLYAIFFTNAGDDREKQKEAWCKAIVLFGIVNLLGVIGTYSIIKTVVYTIGTLIAPTLAGVCILYLYNGKKMEKGRRFSKWFFYIFYPGHLLVLGLLRIAVVGM